MQCGTGKLSGAVNSHKKLQFALFGLDFGDVDRDIANRILPECFVRGGIPFLIQRPVDAVSLEAPVRGRASIDSGSSPVKRTDHHPAARGQVCARPQSSPLPRGVCCRARRFGAHCHIARNHAFFTSKRPLGSNHTARPEPPGALDQFVSLAAQPLSSGRCRVVVVP